MDPLVVIAIVELVLKYGFEGAIKLITGLDTPNPTVEQIRALKVKDPETYFEEE